MHRIALTPGEPAGIGPDLTIMLAQHARHHELVAVADEHMLLERARALGLPLTIRPFLPGARAIADAAGHLCVWHCATSTTSQPGQLNPANAAYVLSTLDAAVDGCVAGHFDAMVTGPVHKGVINDAGIAFTGHTEYLAERTGGSPVMMLVADELRVALATTHLPLSAVAAAITPTVLEQVITILHADLRHRFSLAQPRILVCGLNPHAGEGGHLGREEIDIIEPALQRLRKKGLDLVGPLPADTLFTPQHLDSADAVLAMFHDQGLPVLKYAGFGHGVNVTLGLPIVRTSVDHGTAIDKAGLPAGHGGIELGSLDAAVTLAATLATRSQDSSTVAVTERPS